MKTIHYPSLQRENSSISPSPLRNFYSKDDLSLINPLTLIETVLKLRDNPLVSQNLKANENCVLNGEINSRKSEENQEIFSRSPIAGKRKPERKKRI